MKNTREQTEAEQLRERAEWARTAIGEVYRRVLDISGGGHTYVTREILDALTPAYRMLTSIAGVAGGETAEVGEAVAVAAARDELAA